MNSITLEQVKQNLESHVGKIQERLGSLIVSVERDRQNTPIFWIRREQIVEALKALRDTDGLEYRFLADLTAYDDVDGPKAAEGRFVVVYQLYSPQYKTRIRIKVRAPEGVSVPTAVDAWDAANWAEREVFDMYGIKFEGHPDLRRILLDVRWVGHPLRKDYPLRKQQLFNDPEPMPEHLLKD